ncbi:MULTISPECIES: GGDEF domain-containing protein [unclassified Undibacterium]|uniref:GGDEF domain-containing protein n=2 Tax=Pseudomonadota TaxID=1224 RepID=UPI002AC958DC|nr:MULTISPECIES: GGDEF domain-containing protein [unclassified Undibacterium]MEB0139193.1 GGDEF domain-containing protein [Undibacterium sp. CCC2.1]MEB0172232.1 GGDEF domain-containing protein [Undibacterium sp. CCC1.1]MEB0175911.1 GGDEF domain-containing protein [Undibacterium sp. CCC3.4]MEB0215229.1 GGDEF domain-containing protein [Undibacterium sp. 5I2]WPX43527.1 GGDEF domain-containing protein [Undibacterium sp. CCC3.4]
MVFSTATYRLEDIHLFRDITVENLRSIRATIAHCPIVKARNGQVVLDANSSGSRLYIVLSGALGITRLNEDNNHIENSITQYLPGECVGEISVLDEEIHSATISALVDSDLLVLEAEILWRLIDESNGVARNLLQLLSFRIRAANAQIRSRQKVGEFYRQLSMVDGLTGLHNRAWLNSQLPTLVEQSQSSKHPLSIILVDLDHFKKFNDEFGHLLGDDALQTAAKVLNAGLRPTDFAARYGGEEMMVILPSTSAKAALGVAQRLCTRLAKTKVFADNRKALPHITGSFGVATLLDEQSTSDFINAADQALYRAKEQGRNRVAV